MNKGKNRFDEQYWTKWVAIWKKNKVDSNLIPYIEMINDLNENVKV